MAALRNSRHLRFTLAAPVKPAEPTVGGGENVFLTYNDLQALGVGIPRRPHLRRLIKAGYFPAPYQLTPNRIIWRQSEIRRWMETRPVAASAA